MIQPSEDFLLLAATLIDSLPPSLPIDDALLLQLHAVFGPMLVSALQLMDKREGSALVVRITLPSDRFVYQVASSTGKDYTLYLDPPAPSPPDPIALPPPSPPAPSSPPVSHNESDEVDTEIRTPPASPPKTSITSLPIPQDPQDKSPEIEREKQKRVYELAKTMRRMYCPCAGFAYNSLSGDRTVVCKHILAVIISHKLDRDVKADVGLAGVVGLLGLGGNAVVGG